MPRAAISRATTSRGASSSVKRLPCSSSSSAPSPRRASESSSDESTSVVGWNWTNSRSASAAPARYAAAIPSPTAPAGFVVRSQRAAAPPVERRVARAVTARRSVTTPTQRSSSRQIESMRSPSATVIRGCARTRSASVRATRSPVAAPPAWTTRRRPWPPSSPRPSSKSTPSSTRSRIRAGASSVRTETALGRQSPRPARSVSSAWSDGIVVLSHRRGDPALREEARRREKRPLREHEDVAFGGCAERGEEPGDASTDDDEGKLAVVTCIPRCAHGSFRL